MAIESNCPDLGGKVLKPNYAINPTPELDLRSNRAILPARVIAALGLLWSSADDTS